MNKEIAKDEFESITELVNNALAAPNKASAKTYLGQLEFKKTSLSGPTLNMYSEMVAFVINATGRVADKPQKVDIAMQYLYKLKMFCVEG